MQLSNDTVTTIATRAASLLAEWIGLSPLAKSNNGDQSARGGMVMIFGAMAASKAPPPPADAAERMTQHIHNALTAQLADRDGTIYLVFDVDYGPGRELVDLSEACGIRSSWPIKSSMSVTAYPNSGIQICDRRGYRDEGFTHHLVKDRGWLVSPCRIDRRLTPLVIEAIERGAVDAHVARLDAI